MSFCPRIQGLGILIAELHGGRQRLHEGGAVGTQGVEAPRAQQRFQHAAVDLLQVEAAAQVFQASERAVGFALGDESVDGALPHPADRAQAVADRALAANSKLISRGVDIRRLDFEVDLGAFLDEDDHLVGVVHVRQTAPPP